MEWEGFLLIPGSIFPEYTFQNQTQKTAESAVTGWVWGQDFRCFHHKKRVEACLREDKQLFFAFFLRKRDKSCVNKERRKGKNKTNNTYNNPNHWTLERSVCENNVFDTCIGKPKSRDNNQWIEMIGNDRKSIKREVSPIKSSHIHQIYEEVGKYHNSKYISCELKPHFYNFFRALFYSFENWLDFWHKIYIIFLYSYYIQKCL